MIAEVSGAQNTIYICHRADISWWFLDLVGEKYDWSVIILAMISRREYIISKRRGIELAQDALKYYVRET